VAMVDHPERSRAPFTQLEMRGMWTYGDGALTVRAYRAAADTAGAGAGVAAGSWVLVDQATGTVAGVVAPGEFSRRFRPVDVFADVPGLPGYLGTVTAPDGAALVDLVLDRNPFMLANGPERAARPHVLMVPRRHRDGWSSATAQELAARHTAMTLVAAWYRSLDGGHAVFAANDSPPNLDYLRDAEAAGATPAVGDADVPVTRNPRQDVQRAHLHAFYAEDEATENHESSAVRGHPVLAQGDRAFGDDLSGDAVRVDGGAAMLAAGDRVAVRPWGGSYCSYQRGADGPFWVMPALGSSQDEFNRRLARADGLEAEPDPRLGGAVNLVRPSLDGTGRRAAAQRATAQQRAGFQAFAARRGLNAQSLSVLGLAPDGGVHGDDLGRARAGIGAPPRHRHQAGFHQGQVIEEADVLGARARRENRGPEPGVVALRAGRHDLSVDVPGGVGHGQETAGRDRAHQAGHDGVRVVRVRYVLHGAQHHDGNGLAEVERLGRLVQHLVGVAQVSVDVVARPLRGARQQGPRVGEHDRVVVHVDHSAFRRDLLGDLMGVLRGGQAGADVKELADPRLGRKIAHGPPQEGAVSAHAGEDDRADLDDRLGGGPVGGKVVLAAEQVVVHAGRVSGADVERRRVLRPVRIVVVPPASRCLLSAQCRMPSSNRRTADPHPDNR